MDTIGFAHTAAFRGLGPEGQLTSQILLHARVSTPPEYLLFCYKAHASISFGTFCATKVAGASGPPSNGDQRTSIVRCFSKTFFLQEIVQTAISDEEIDSASLSFGRRSNELSAKHLTLGVGQFLGEYGRSERWTRRLGRHRTESFFAKVTFSPQLKSC